MTDSKNLVHLMSKKFWSRTPAVNALVASALRVAREIGVRVRVVWHSREVPAAKAADALSRCDVPGFQVAFEGCFRAKSGSRCAIPCSTLKEVTSCLGK
jgi:hypothetical protein